MTDPVSPESVVARRPGLIESQVDDEVVALNIETGVCYGLNSTGSRIWMMLAQPVRVSAICAALVGTYEVQGEVCEREVIGLIEDLRSEGLVTVAP